MTWVRTDDRAPHHPKLLRAGAEAAWLWQAGLCFSNAYKLDGRLGKDLLPALYPPLASKVRPLAARLVLVGLWHDRGDHYEIHGYQDHQGAALKESVDARQEYERERKRVQRGRERPPVAVPDMSGTMSGTMSPGSVPDMSGNCPVYRPELSRVLARASPVPSRPDPRDLATLALSGEACATGPSAGQIRTRFQALFQARFQALPYLGGGEVVTTFAERLRVTASERGLDALELLGQTFEQWAARPLDEIAQNAPYAAFAARFGSLCGAKGTNGASELDELHAAQIAALAAKDFDRYRSLVDEEKRRVGSK